MIRWLHISDLHIKNKADWNSFKKELVAKCEKIGVIDFVVVTGDFHDFSDKGDFSLAEAFLKQLMKELKLDIQKSLFVVPGNHDGVSSVPDKNTYISAAIGKPLELEEKWLNVLYGAFEDYEVFVKKLIPDYPVNHPARVHHRDWNSKINFIHCNTALVADGKQKGNQLLDIDKLVMEEYRKDIPNIILAHNSFKDLNVEHQKRIQDVIRTNPVCAYFCGDKHIEEVEQITYESNQNKQIPCVVSYKSSPEATDSYSVFGMIIGEWREEEPTAYLRGWTWKSGIGFKTDAVITEQEIDMTGRLERKSEANVNIEDKILLERKKYEKIPEEKVVKKDVEEVEKRRFVKLYYSMTPDQREKINRKYPFKNIKLKKKMEPKELIQYVEWVEEEGLLEQMIRDMKNMF